MTKSLLHKAAQAVTSLQMISDSKVSEILLEVAVGLRDAAGDILSANALDLARMSPDNPKYDRLKLT